ncbi:phage protein D [bacterium (Candidatus Blackallbacteria) CG13_big_fil_rev_8_21_14_2_50_49_14]|nr:MAG: phage protein D [bacterium (Candidatus Blackallbacteria) CG18_big_fil_WC_8_21_14_2_50_49_26]PIW46652.1 MAG: phage protein D [bacterium (Candidatus Blackallbacteria) CG13_big_fil_rev_8_21_14_2_50_49_14]
MEVKQAIKPDFKLFYAGKDVTHDLAPYITEIVYTDRLTGQSDELDVSLVDPDGRWMDAWYPEKGAEIKLEYGYTHKPLIKAGAFEVDEIEIEGPPSTVRIRALSAGLSRQARTRLGKAYEKTTLKAIVEKVAKRLKAKVSGQIADIQIPKATQYGETDWAFLVRLCREYGYEVKLTDNNQTLVVAKLKDLASQKAVRVITPADLISYQYRDKITEVPAKTEVKHQNRRKKKLVKGEAQNKLTLDKTASDTHKKILPVDSKGQAQAVADAEQERQEIDKTSFTINLWGDASLVAGARVTASKFGKLNGEYMIVESKHTISRSGYSTESQMKRVSV